LLLNFSNDMLTTVVCVGYLQAGSVGRRITLD